MFFQRLSRDHIIPLVKGTHNMRSTYRMLIMSITLLSFSPPLLAEKQITKS